MLARRIIAKHVTSTTTYAMLGATVILSALQVLFTYLGELSALNESYTAWRA
ncbi:MAG: LPS export ABC transporter permease LptG, partial [Acinetobacter harbinensis]|nr:LPS export ABC transporter permease LptG [Acinetobacter harbinensis]